MLKMAFKGWRNQRSPLPQFSAPIEVTSSYLNDKAPLRNTVSLKKLEFWRQFSKALRKLNHVLLLILSTNTGL